MSLARRFWQWLRGCLFRDAAAPGIAPEVKELASRVDAIEEHTLEQDRRLSLVEVRVGVRRPEWRTKRDAG